MIAIKRDGLLTTIETKELVTLVEKVIIGLDFAAVIDPEWSYETQVKEYQLLLDNLRDID